MSETSVPRGRDKHPPPSNREAGFADGPYAELLEAAEEALAWMRDCEPKGEDRYEVEAEIRVRLRRAIRGVRRS
ncbi:MAG: hypothetical protein M3P49_14980 [Actinomycetota bacterium]|nr:hypothetical protein [Actinomycetota bacterium]